MNSMASRKRKRDEVEMRQADGLELELSSGSSSKVSRGSSLDAASDASENIFGLSSIDEYQNPITREEILNDEDIAKYWPQRYALFSLFDKGIVLDKVGWYSVTPEAIALHTAKRFLQALGPRATVIDAMCGVGGNAIQFANYFNVIAIELSEERINMAKHNSRLYGVSERITFLHGDFFELAPSLRADAVFLSPPWGGPAYATALRFDLNVMDGFRIFETALKISKNIAYYLPRNVDENHLVELALKANSVVEKENCFLNNRFKAVTAYFGALAGADHVERELALTPKPEDGSDLATSDTASAYAFDETPSTNTRRKRSKGQRKARVQ